jgi:hypothetical protein
MTVRDISSATRAQETLTGYCFDEISVAGLIAALENGFCLLMDASVKDVKNFSK